MIQSLEINIKSEYDEGDMPAFDTNASRLPVRRSARSFAAIIVRTLLASAVLMLSATRVSYGSDANIMSGMHGGHLATIISELPPDHPVGTNATVAVLSFKPAIHLHEPCLSMFLVDYLPGGSALLHRSPTAGYVLVHVLSGEIRAQAWEAGMGTYRSGQTWVEPAVATDIITKNASAVEPARALVVLMTNETSALQSEDR